MVARNRTQVTETLSGVTRVITYTYDGLYRLTTAEYSSGERYAYQYDAGDHRSHATVRPTPRPPRLTKRRSPPTLMMRLTV